MKHPKNEGSNKGKKYFKTVRENPDKDKIDMGDVRKYSYTLKDYKEGELPVFQKINNLGINPEIKENNEIINKQNSLLLSVDNNIVIKKQKIIMKDNRMEIEELINPDAELIDYKSPDPKLISDTNDITYDIDYDKLFGVHTQLRAIYDKMLDDDKMERIMNEFKETEENNPGVRINVNEFIAMSLPKKEFTDTGLIDESTYKLENPIHYSKVLEKVRMAKKAHEFKKPSCEYVMEIANLLDSIGRYDEYLLILEHAINISKGILHEPYYSKGIIHYRLKNYRLALNAFTSCSKIKPNYFHTNFYRGKCLFFLTQYQEANECFNEHLSNNPNCSDTHLLMGDCHLFFKDYDSACISYKNALLHDPCNSYVIEKLGDLHFIIRNFEKAVIKYIQALDHDNYLATATIKALILMITLDKINEAKAFVDSMLAKIEYNHMKYSNNIGITKETLIDGLLTIGYYPLIMVELMTKVEKKNYGQLNLNNLKANIEKCRHYMKQEVILVLSKLNNELELMKFDKIKKINTKLSDIKSIFIEFEEENKNLMYNGSEQTTPNFTNYKNLIRRSNEELKNISKDSNVREISVNGGESNLSIKRVLEHKYSDSIGKIDDDQYSETVLSINLNNNKKKKNIENINEDLQLREDAGIEIRINENIVYEDLTKGSKKLNVSENKRIRRLFKRIPLLTNCSDYNEGYDYFTVYESYTRKELKGIWNNPIDIFHRSKNAIRFDLKLTSLTDVLDHYFENEMLWYIIEDKKTNIAHSFCIFDCFSLSLFEKVRDYLFMDYDGKCNDICRSTKIMEMIYYMTIFEIKLNPELTIDEVVRFGKESRDINNTFENQNIFVINDIEQIKSMFISKDNQLGVTCMKNYRTFNFELEEFVFYCKGDVYNNFLKNKKNCKYMIKVEKRTMQNVLFDNETNKLSKERKKKKFSKYLYNIRRNTGNCFFHALNSISEYFPTRDFVDAFKKLPILDQFDKANYHLWKFGKKLKLIRETRCKGEKFIKTCIGPSLVVFYNNYSRVHCEPVIDGDIIGDIQSHVKELLSGNLVIKEIQIVGIDD